MIKKIAFVALLATAAPSFAVVSPFGGGGASGVDPLGHSWTMTTEHWGEPGWNNGTLSFNPGALTGTGTETYATSFSFTFLKGVDGVIESALPNSNFDATRFYNVATGNYWLKSFTGNTVTFTAATFADRLKVNDSFFVNVHFTGPVNAAKFSFAGLWDEESVTGAVPEPATWAMMIAGFGLVGASMRRRSAAVSFA